MPGDIWLPKSREDIDSETLKTVNSVLGKIPQLSLSVRKIIEMRSNFIKDDSGYAGCKVGDRFVTATDDIAAPNKSSSNGSNGALDEETITLKKSELVDMVSKIVANIVGKR